MSHHLGYGRGHVRPEGVSSHRNGTSAKTFIAAGGRAGGGGVAVDEHGLSSAP